MASVTNILRTTKTIAGICNRLASISLKRDPFSQVANKSLLCSTSTLSVWSTKQFHSTSVTYDLMEFFDNKKNWGENEVKCGRAWSTDDLRIKSNPDLHKLWYILLKEKNMLLTMEHECNDKMELFPSPERLDKVKISMSNLETVVRERNKAYYELETGETGERPGKVQSNQLGIKYYYRSCEHAIPAYMNTKWFAKRKFSFGGRAVRKFLKLYREKLYNEKRKFRNRQRNEVMMLLRRNPNLSRTTLNKKFPGVNIDKLIDDDKTRGHFAPKI